MLDTLQIKTATFLSTVKAKLAKLHKSWTAWFNAVCAFAAFAWPQLPTLLPQLSGYIPQMSYGFLLIIAIAGNLLLRFKTNTALENK